MKPPKASPVKTTLCFIFLFVCLFHLNAETIEGGAGADQTANASLFLAFHDMGWNMLRSVTYNYGANFAGAAFGTWVFVETGMDWYFRNIMYNNLPVARAGLPFLFAGYFVPVVIPAAMYLTGRISSDYKLQIAGLAVAQSLMLSQILQVSLKMLTDRTGPGIISDVFFEPYQARDDRKKDFSGEFKWFTLHFYDGWPSGHVLSAFSAAVAISEIYSDKPLLKAGLYTYALCMGIGVAVNAHWVSESVASFLMGYAVGKAVGRSFNQLLGKDTGKDKVSLFATADTMGVWIKI